MALFLDYPSRVFGQCAKPAVFAGLALLISCGEKDRKTQTVSPEKKFPMAAHQTSGGSVDFPTVARSAAVENLTQDDVKASGPAGASPYRSQTPSETRSNPSTSGSQYTVQEGGTASDGTRSKARSTRSGTERNGETSGTAQDGASGDLAGGSAGGTKEEDPQTPQNGPYKESLEYVLGLTDEAAKQRELQHLFDVWANEDFTAAADHAATLSPGLEYNAAAEALANRLEAAGDKDGAKRWRDSIGK